MFSSACSILLQGSREREREREKAEREGEREERGQVVAIDSIINEHYKQ